MIDSVIIFTYFIVVLIIGIYKGRDIGTMRDFSIADKKYTLPVMVATISATDIGSGSTFGIVESVFSSGIVFILIAFGSPINLMIVSRFFAHRLEKFQDCISVGDIMARFYGKSAQIMTGILGTLYCAAAVGAQVSAIGLIVQYFFQIPYLLGVLVGIGIVIIYSSFGGIRAVTATDVIQFAVLIIAIPMVCNIGLNLVGGYQQLFSKLPPHLISLPSEPTSIIRYFFIFLAFAIPFLDPATMQRILMGRDIRQIQHSFQIAAWIGVPFFFLTGLIGLTAVVLNPNLDPNMALPHLINTILPFGLKGLAVAGLLAVVMSTADSYLNAGGIALVHDVIKPIYADRLNEKRELFLAKFLTFALGLLAAIVALNFQSIMGIILFSLNFWGPLVVFPLYVGLFGFESNKINLYVSAAFGVATFAIWYLFIGPKTGIDALIPSMAANAIGFFISMSITQGNKSRAKEYAY